MNSVFILRRQSWTALAVLLVGCLLLPWLSRAQFVQPSGNPPNYQPADKIPAIIQGTSNDQTKLGSLLIGEKNGLLANCPGSGCSQLCLNSNVSAGTSDTASCISSWSQLSTVASIGGPYVPLHAANSGAIDLGFMGLQGTPNTPANLGQWTNAQLVSLAAEAYSGVGPTGNGSIRTEATSDNNFAAVFAGTLYVDGPSNAAGTKLYPGKLCLNDQAGAPNTCISNWSDILTMNGTNIIRLQDVGLTTASPDQGNVSSVGPLVTKSLVIGQPTLPVGCGDGICTPLSGESPASCSVDCHN